MQADAPGDGKQGNWLPTPGKGEEWGVWWWCIRATGRVKDGGQSVECAVGIGVWLAPSPLSPHVHSYIPCDPTQLAISPQKPAHTHPLFDAFFFNPTPHHHHPTHLSIHPPLSTNPTTAKGPFSYVLRVYGPGGNAKPMSEAKQVCVYALRWRGGVYVYTCT